MHDVKDNEHSTIIRPESAEPLVPYGRVIGIGPDVKSVSIGDAVLFHPNALVAGFDQHIEPKFILQETSIFGVINSFSNATNRNL